jgi:hypothetical protein
LVKGGYKKRIAGSILDAAARIKKRKDQLRRTTRHFAKVVPIGGGFFEYLL